MPFVYDETQLEWPEDDDDFEPPPPRPDQFVYIPPPDFGGASAPVRFSVVAEPDETATGSNGPPTRSIWNRLLGWWRPSKEEERRLGIQRELERRRRKHVRRRQRFFGAVIPELRKSGARRIYCRYDGGNDEGFVWLDSIEMQDGERIAAPVRTIGEQHVKDDLGWIPSVKDWLQHLQFQPWMGQTPFRPQLDERTDTGSEKTPQGSPVL